jgi:glutamate synthase (ferredoxin)
MGLQGSLSSHPPAKVGLRAGRSRARIDLKQTRYVDTPQGRMDQTKVTPPPPRERRMPQHPAKQGLYDPRFEHDACGVGFVVHLKGFASHDIVRQGLQVLLNLDHRGACGCEVNTGDGAGILLQTPDKFLRKVCAPLGVSLPERGRYGVGMVFSSTNAAERSRAQEILQRIVLEEGQLLLGWREVPVNNESLGETARASEPFMRQVFIGRGTACSHEQAFERKLYVIRQRAAHEIRRAGVDPAWYMASLSGRTIVYKGMLKTTQLDAYYPDLSDPDTESALALVHSRFSTNTFPSWDRAHPYRLLAHNGEINTLRGNINWMHAQESLLESELFGPDIAKLLPVVDENGSDSAAFDNCLELLVQGGYSVPHAVMMMIPEPWENHESMPDERRAFYEYHSCLMEPWDGPASIAFTDGQVIGAVLDRNGLRPSRYYLTKDDLVIMASEAGVLAIPPERVAHKGRLQPGRMFLVDTRERRIISDEEIKRRTARQHPYRLWLDQNHVLLKDLPESPYVSEADQYRQWIEESYARTQHLPEAPSVAQMDHRLLLQRQTAFGYTYEDLRMIIGPMARDGVQPLGSMGTDTPLAVLSHRPQLLYNYFKQLFAQVTNPAIDPIREEIVTSTATMLGPRGNLLVPRPKHCRTVKLPHPLLTNEELEKLRHVRRAGFQSATLSMLFSPGEGTAGLDRALDRLFADADAAIAHGANIIILSDRGVDRDHVAVPALLATSGLHHHLVRNRTRVRVGLVVESGEPREVHHFALLIGYGASAVNPYLAFETLDDMIREGLLLGQDLKTAIRSYIKGAVKGVVKTIAKMGISTIQSYRGAQIFEAVGLHPSLIDKYFTWTPSRVGGADLDAIGRELLARHAQAFPDRPLSVPALDAGGQYQWRQDGEGHLFSPETIHKLQLAVRTGRYEVFQQYSALVNRQEQEFYTLRGLLEFKPATPIPIEEVEPIEAILCRFKSGAMSYGSISQEAHEALAIAMNRIGGKSNTGEGGEDPERYTWTNEQNDSKNSRIKQVASGRFGVTSLYLTKADELQIKVAQGAKPGEGGELPGRKVYPWIAKTRMTTAGVGLISPPPHHDIYSIEDLAELIHDLKNANREARISVKLVAEVGVGTIAAGVAKAHADVVLISGHDGGTGASPLSSIKHAGLPWELGLAETHQTLVLNKLRSRIVVETDGQLKTGRDVAIAALLGAEEFGFATAPLVTLGCIMMRVCHQNTCPVGVATQNPELRERFTGDPAHVVNFMRFVARELREIMAQLGIRTVNEMVGRSDLLEPRQAIDHWKAKGLDFSNILYQPPVGPEVGRYCSIPQDHGLDQSLDLTVLLDRCRPAIERGEQVRASFSIRNVHRAVGTIVGNEVTKRWGADGLPEDTIRLHFNGSAGQSFGAFVPRGMTLEIEGDANDYLGKGLSGGILILYPPAGSTFAPEENVITGNVAFYGATSGKAYLRGMAGERFCVRNSGVDAVVEAVGDHGCEYMTGGTVVILGPTGRNFAAGMSGGIAYILDEQGDFSGHCNLAMVGLEPLDDEDSATLKQMIEDHAINTRSARAAMILSDWDTWRRKFVKVLPKDYKRVLQSMKRVQDQGLTGDEAIMAAFEENARDAARVGGG